MVWIDNNMEWCEWYSMIHNLRTCIIVKVFSDLVWPLKCEKFITHTHTHVHVKNKNVCASECIIYYDGNHTHAHIHNIHTLTLSLSHTHTYTHTHTHTHTHTQALPPYNGYGSLEDSLQSCLTLVPQPPKKDFIKMMENHGKILRFLAILVTWTYI